MLALDPYLTFDGNCADAMRFYQQTLGGQLDVMTFSQAPAPMCDQFPPGSGDRVMHACLTLADRRLMASDTMPGMPHEGMKGFGLALSYADVAEAQRIFGALGQGGQVTMPMEKTFWAESFGMLTDRFGTPWMINGGEIVHTPT